MKGPSAYLATACSVLTFCIYENKSSHNTKLSQCTIPISPPAILFFLACLYCHHFMKVCECGLWLNVLENSQGEEPFISQASAITEACSHRHNHLLELLEIGSPKRYGLGVHHSIKGKAIYVGVPLIKILFSVFVEPLGVKHLPCNVNGEKHQK